MDCKPKSQKGKKKHLKLIISSTGRPKTQAIEFNWIVDKVHQRIYDYYLDKKN